MTAGAAYRAVVLRETAPEDGGDSRVGQNRAETGQNGPSDGLAALRRGTPASRAGAAARQGAACVVTRWWRWAVVAGAVAAVVGVVGWWVG